MPNAGQILKAHNKKVLNVDRINDQDNPDNCRNKTNCHYSLLDFANSKALL